MSKLYITMKLRKIFISFYILQKYINYNIIKQIEYGGVLLFWMYTVGPTGQESQNSHKYQSQTSSRAIFMKKKIIS